MDETAATDTNAGGPENDGVRELWLQVKALRAQLAHEKAQVRSLAHSSPPLVIVNHSSL